jgi:hypothetical protein
MVTPLMRPQSAPLRFIAARLRLPDLSQVVRQPGVGEAWRITVQYHDARHPDQVATLTKAHSANITLTVAYRRADNLPLALTYQIAAERVQGMASALRRLQFDQLDDPPDIPWFGADLWLVERAAGSFHHDVIIPPEQATGTYAEIVRLIREAFREAIRPVNP